MGDVTRVRGWLDSVEAKLAARAKTLAAEGTGGGARETLVLNGRRSGREAQKAAARSETLAANPELDDALANGDVSTDHIDALTRAVAPLPEAAQEELLTDPEVIDAATRMSPDPFNTFVKKKARDLAEDEGEDTLQKQKNATKLRTWFRKDGMLVINGEIDPETGNRLVTDLENEMETMAQRDRAPKNDRTRALALAEPPEHPARGASARPRCWERCLLPVSVHIVIGDPPLNPAQQEVLRLLGATPDQRPVFDRNLRVELKAELEAALGWVAEHIPDGEDLFVSKRHVAQVMSCETKYLAELDDDFQWSIPVARGTITHKAIELSIHWRGEIVPLDLVDEILAKLDMGDDKLAWWYQGLDQTDRAELRSEVNNRLVAFLECWPDLKPAWRPTVEAGVRAELAQRKLILSGKVDLALGRAVGDQAGKVIVDLKTGNFSPTHRDDLRFYALLDAIRIGTPPRMVATYYLDRGEFTPEAITEDVLHATVARVTDAVGRIVAVRFGGAEPETQAGPGCRWCPKLETCSVGTAHVTLENELADVG